MKLENIYCLIINKNKCIFKFCSIMDKISITYTLLQLKVMYMILKKRRKSKRWINRKWLVRPINRLRMQQGDFQHLFQEIKQDPDLFFRFHKKRM